MLARLVAAWTGRQPPEDNPDPPQKPAAVPEKSLRNVWGGFSTEAEWLDHQRRFAARQAIYDAQRAIERERVQSRSSNSYFGMARPPWLEGPD